MKPLILAKFDVKPRIVQLPDGALMGFFVRTVADAQEVAAYSSRDGGCSWKGPDKLFPLPSEPGVWGGTECLVDRDGEVHVFLLNDAWSGVFREVSSEAEKRRLRPRERALDIWHVKSARRGRSWREPRRIWEGYTGALNSVIQMRSGRILLPFSFLTRRTWEQRGEGLDAFWFVGAFESTLVYSDDAGETWHESPDAVKVQTPDIGGAYGACEPVVLELADGRVWMLIRTQLGRFYESFSPDGARWSQPRPSRLINSDSPAGLCRLCDGRIVLLWNCCLRFPYAYGGRHVLHAAVSDDDGATWRGCREVARDPLRGEPPPPHGDHGTAYPFPTALADGSAIFSTGQGEGRIAIVRIDPDWLCETQQADDFSNGLDEWSVFGTRGVDLVPHPDRKGAQALRIHRCDGEFPATAVWNFPLGARGRVDVQMRLLSPGFGGAAIMLTDHFSVPFDPEDELNALYVLRIGSGGKLPDGTTLSADTSHEVSLRWDCATRDCRAIVNGRTAAVLPLLRTGEGVCYLRLKSTAASTGEAGLLVESVQADAGAAGRS